MRQTIAEFCSKAGVGDDRIRDIVDSGYYLRPMMSAPGSAPYLAVSDMLYGSKISSGILDTEAFVKFVRGEQTIEQAPPPRRARVRNLTEIQELLRDSTRARYIAEGSLTLRGQPREHKVRRRVPSPVRADADGFELSILPGVFRQRDDYYSCAKEAHETRSFEHFARAFEEDSDSSNLHFSYDLMRTEQHYASQTAGLDVTFELSSALFFATHIFARNDKRLAFHRAVAKGEHQGVVYLFRFGSPPVRRTEFLIKDFDFFRTHRPERILRQSCGLPLFDAHERNIAVTEIDCVIELDADFEMLDGLTPEYMFPSAKDDAFYLKLLELKDRFPEALANVVEYVWARSI